MSTFIKQMLLGVVAWLFSISALLANNHTSSSIDQLTIDSKGELTTIDKTHPSPQTEHNNNVAFSSDSEEDESSYMMGEWILRGGASGFFSLGSGYKKVSAIIDGKKELAGKSKVKNSATGILSLTYLTDMGLGVELSGTLPHTIKQQVTNLGIRTNLNTKYQQTALSVQYFFENETNFRPYAGLGVSYNYFKPDNISDAMNNDGSKKDVIGIKSHKIAPIVQAGIDYDIGNNWIINASLNYTHSKEIEMKFKDKVGEGKASFKRNFNPFSARITVGYSF